MNGRRVFVVAVAASLVFATGADAAQLPRIDGIGDHASGARDSFVLAFTGDTLPHPRVSQSAARNAGGDGFDFGPMFAEVSVLLHAADLALCHLEVPLDPDSADVAGFPTFSAPAELAVGLAEAGFDGCSTASNHTFDRGPEGVLDTIAVLEAAGLGHAGTAAAAAGSAGVLYDLGGLVVGHSSYAYGFQHDRVPADQPWLANEIDADRIISDAADLKRRGADFTVISLHWGIEFSPAPTASQRALAERLLADPAVDLIVGHHPHVLQPIAAVAGKTVLYSLGNLLSNQTAPCCPPESEEGAVVLVRVDRAGDGWKVGDVVDVPFWVDRHGGHVITPALGAAAEESSNRRRLATAASRTARMLGPLSTGLDVGAAYRWVLSAAPSPWQSQGRRVAGPTAGDVPAAVWRGVRRV